MYLMDIKDSIQFYIHTSSIEFCDVEAGCDDFESYRIRKYIQILDI